VSSRVTRVLYLAHSFSIGGAEEMVFTLTRRLPPRFAPRVCCITSAGPIGQEMQRAGVEVDVLGLNPGLRRPQDVMRLRAYLERTRAHVVHTFLLTASLYGRFAAMLARVPVIVGTEVNVYENKRKSHALAERLLMQGTDCVVVSAESVRDFYVRQVHADPARVKVIYNAVDWSALGTTMSGAGLRAQLQIPEDAAVMTIIARLTAQKAHHVLLEAIAATPALASAHLLVVGDGELRAELVQRAQALGLGARVHFAGPRRDLGNVLAASDLFVMPSLWEGLPLSMVLAMGAGLPVVATRVAGIPEVVKDGVTGLLVDPANVSQLGEALASLVGDPALRARLGAAASDFARPRFGADRYVDAITDLYDSLLAAKGVA
jgi:glycosyltransferase involved in cell wall biosynthesis